MHHILLKKTDLANLKSDVDKLNIDKLKNVLSNLNNSKNKVDKLDVDKLVPTPVDLCKLSDVVKIMLLNNAVPRASILNLSYNLSKNFSCIIFNFISSNVCLKR